MLQNGLSAKTIFYTRITRKFIYNVSHTIQNLLEIAID